MNNKLTGYYTSAEAQAALGVSGAALKKIASKEGWSVVQLSARYSLYPADDVLEYRDHRLRTQLARKMGWNGRGLHRADEIDIACPECGAFAIEWPPPPELAVKWYCVNGHSGGYLSCPDCGGTFDSEPCLTCAGTGSVYD